VKPLVICVDRDDDIGRKAGVKGPILGREHNLDAAQKLALADPCDTDVNALYGAIKLAGELETEVVTLTGEGHVGVVSDREIARQLDEVLAKLKPESIIFVSDGLDDEQVMPIIQSRVKIDSVQTITVRQSKELEKAYFKLTNFIKEVTGEPSLARLIFGLPGVALVLLAVGGIQALSWIMGVMGLYLIIKGFGFEEQLFSTTTEFLKSLSVERLSTILYVLALIVFGLGVGYAYQDLQRNNLSFADSATTLNTLGLFILNSGSVNLILLSIVLAISGRLMDDWAVKKFIHVRRDFILIAFTALIAIVLDAGANYVINENYGFNNFIIRGLIGVLTLAAWIKMTELIFKTEIRIIMKVMSETEGKEVAEADGRKLGKVTKAVVENMKLKEIRVGGRAFRNKDIVSIGEVIVVKKMEDTPFAPMPQIGEAIRQLKMQTPQNFPKLPDWNYYQRRKKTQAK
jgi:putative membrane protein